MSDEIDRAQAREEEMRADALAVPGVQTCVECQADIERMGMW